MTIDEFFYAVGKGDYDVASIPTIVASQGTDRYPKAMCLLKLCADRGSKCGPDDIEAIAASIDEHADMGRYWDVAALAVQAHMLSPEDVDKLVDMAIASNSWKHRVFFVSTGRMADPDDERFQTWPHFTSFREARAWDGEDALRLYREVEDDPSVKCGKIMAALESGEVAATYANAQEMAAPFVGRTKMPFKLRVYEDFCKHGLEPWENPGVFGIPFESHVYTDALRVASDHAEPRLAWAKTVHHAAFLVERCGLVTTVEEVVAKFGKYWPIVAKAMYDRGYLKTPPGDLPKTDVVHEHMYICLHAHRAGIKLDWTRDRMDVMRTIPLQRALSYLAQLYHAGFRPEPYHVDFKRLRAEQVEQTLLFFMPAGMDYVTATNAVAELAVDTTGAKAIIAFYETRQRRAIWNAYTFFYPDHAVALVQKRGVDDAPRTVPYLPPDLFRLIASKLDEPVLNRVRFP